MALVIRSAFEQYRGALEPPSGALTVDAAAAQEPVGFDSHARPSHVRMARQAGSVTA